LRGKPFPATGCIHTTGSGAPWNKNNSPHVPPSPHLSGSCDDSPAPRRARLMISDTRRTYCGLSPAGRAAAFDQARLVRDRGRPASKPHVGCLLARVCFGSAAVALGVSGCRFGPRSARHRPLMARRGARCRHALGHAESRTPPPWVLMFLTSPDRSLEQAARHLYPSIRRPSELGFRGMRPWGRRCGSGEASWRPFPGITPPTPPSVPEAAGRLSASRPPLAKSDRQGIRVI